MKRYAPLPPAVIDELLGEIAVGDAVQVRTPGGAPRVGRVDALTVIGRHGGGEYRDVPQVRIDVLVLIEPTTSGAKRYARTFAPHNLTRLAPLIQSGVSL